MALRVGCVLLALCAAGARGEMIMLSAVEPIIDFPPTPTAQCLPAKLPFAEFHFEGQPDLKSITEIQFSMTMEDGDTSPGNFDFNQLSLGLGSVDTGLKLNGFTGGKELSLSFDWKPTDAGWPSAGGIAQLLDDLKDKVLVASILDATPNDNCVNLYSAFDTTIKIFGERFTSGGNPHPVPEPASMFIWIAVGLTFFRARRLKGGQKIG